ncbi:helix-turn-helix domain-containing protein [Actinomadura decatromicini]|uniref:Helix-turn-helix transcriptional regulator n=1 Tax=Actinomadura decatromicini TaxID=2604572 RepID=A0A5D3FSA8_9ACTN|nr:helix-turn-helix transcriptional regulator [Actinomadura decatromicini]TYK51231.1 helix-turn-helix transcriptional regulator [Actinomadura decatromicini]
MNQRNGRSPRKFLGKEIMLARQEKGMNRDELAKAVFVSESSIRQWERGRRIPRPEDLMSAEKILGLGDGEKPGFLARMRNELVSDAVPVEWFGQWREVEKVSNAWWTFEPLLIPGLLQTEDYASTVLRASHRNADPKRMLAERLERQQLLDAEEPPKLVALIAEGALRNLVADCRTMRGQLSHLVEMARRANVIVQVIPADSSVCAGFLSGFVIASIENAEDVAYVDNQLTGEVIEDTQEVARLRYMFDDFRAEALRAHESISFIMKIIEELWTESDDEMA